MKTNKIVLLFILTLAITGLNRCSYVRYEAGRDYLAHQYVEQGNYGLYSYFLFSEKPGNLEKDRYIAVIESYLQFIEIEKLEEYFSRDSLNICYIPVFSEPGEFFKSLDIHEKAEWILENYDFARARSFLNKIDQNLLEGLYIISYNKPLSQVSTLETKYLIQDLSKVHNRIIPLWINEFLLQSSKAEYWDEEHLNNLTHYLRNNIAIAAEGLSDIRESLNLWILLK